MDARLMDFRPDGILVLEDGTVYRGHSFGSRKTVVGEAVFNTSMTGYQEILTDPSYYQQVVAMTTSQVGNYGVNSEDVESAAPKVQGFVVRESAPRYSNWRSEDSLSKYLEKGCRWQGQSPLRAGRHFNFGNTAQG